MNERDRYHTTLAKLLSYGTSESEARHLAYIASKAGAREDQQAGAHHRRTTEAV